MGFELHHIEMQRFPPPPAAGKDEVFFSSSFKKESKIRDSMRDGTHF